MKNSTTFKTKTGYFHKLSTPKTMKFLESTKSKKTDDKDSKNASHLEITEAQLVRCKLSKRTINMTQESYKHLFLRNRLISCLKVLFFKNF